MPPKRRKASVDRDDDPSPTSIPATKRRKKSALNYDPVCHFVEAILYIQLIPFCKDTNF